jgi:hypothetical protein
MQRLANWKYASKRPRAASRGGIETGSKLRRELSVSLRVVGDGLECERFVDADGAQMVLEFWSRLRSVLEKPAPALSVEASSDKIVAAALFASVISFCVDRTGVCEIPAF